MNDNTLWTIVSSKRFGIEVARLARRCSVRPSERHTTWVLHTEEFRIPVFRISADDGCFQVNACLEQWLDHD